MDLLAPAKINLHLRVGRRRDDGFHPLLTWMCTVGLVDSLKLEAVSAAAQGAAGAAPPAAWRAGRARPAEATHLEGFADGGAGVELVIRGDGDRPDLPRDGRNLVVRIATAFADEVRRERASRTDPRHRPVGSRAEPAFREEGADGPDAPAAAWAAEREPTGPTASAGAAPRAPGTAGEDPPAHRDGSAADGRAVAGSAGMGAGAVRGAERSGRSHRHEDRAPEMRGPHVATHSDAHRDTRRDARDADQESHAEPGENSRARPDAESRAAWLRVALDKRVPIGAGLGGGSSDAAHTLVALDRMLAAGWSAGRLSEFSGRFGSDVPFFVHAALGSPSAACRGRGEVVRPVPAPAARRAVIFSPPFGLSTRDVYGRFDEMNLGFDEALAPDEEPDWARWAKLPARELLKRLVNDLEPAAFSLSPDLAALRAGLERELGRVVRMSGSGSSLFTLFDESDESAAREAVRVGQAAGAASVMVGVAPGVASRD